MRQQLLSTIGVLLLAAGGVAQDAATPGAETAADKSAVDPQTKTARRLLRAPNGGVMREESRLVDGHWEIKRDGRWTALPEGLVASVRGEDEVLAEWRQRRKDVRKDDVEARVALAE